MELQYEIRPLEIKEWFQEPNELKFINVPQTDNGLQYSLRISSYNHQEPDFYIFEVVMNKTVGSHVAVNFKASAVGAFKIKLEKNVIPEPNLYFLFLETATRQFVDEFSKRTAGTNHQFHRIPVPRFEALKDQLQTYIDTWDKDIRHTALN